MLTDREFTHAKALMDEIVAVGHFGEVEYGLLIGALAAHMEDFEKAHYPVSELTLEERLSAVAPTARIKIIENEDYHQVALEIEDAHFRLEPQYKASEPQEMESALTLAKQLHTALKKSCMNVEIVHQGEPA